MKLLLSSFFLLIQITLFSQNWFQDDDHWVYKSTGFLYDANIDMTVGKDTFLLGKQAKVLNFYIIDSDDVGTLEPAQEFEKIAYEEDKKVYIYITTNLKLST